MTDIDIEHLKYEAEHFSGICDGCNDPDHIYIHPWAAVLALIERLEKTEAQRDRLQEQNEALRKGKPIGPIIGAQALIWTTQQRNQLVRLVESAYQEGWNDGYSRGVSDSHPLNHGASHHEEDWSDSETKGSLNATTREIKDE